MVEVRRLGRSLSPGDKARQVKACGWLRESDTREFPSGKRFDQGVVYGLCDPESRPCHPPESSKEYPELARRQRDLSSQSDREIPQCHPQLRGRGLPAKVDQPAELEPGLKRARIADLLRSSSQPTIRKAGAEEDLICRSLALPLRGLPYTA